MPDRANQPPALSPAQLAEVLTKLPAGVKVNVEKLSTGDLSVSVVDAPAPTKDQLIAQKYAHLRGVGVTLSQAAEKYGVPRNAIEGWVYNAQCVGFVNEAAYPKLVDEAEVALCAAIYQERKSAGGLTGFPFFDESGRLLTGPKHPERSRRRQNPSIK